MPFLEAILFIHSFFKIFLDYATENIKELSVLVVILFLFIFFTVAIFKLIYGFYERSKKDSIPRIKVLLLSLYFLAFIGFGFFSFGTGPINNICSWVSACSLAIFLVILQNFFGYKNEKYIESIYNNLCIENEGFLQQKLQEQKERDTNLQKEIVSLTDELQKLNLENKQLGNINIHLTITKSRSLFSFLSDYLINKR